MRKKFAVLFLFVGIAFQVFGQNEKQDPLSFYDSQLFKFSYNIMGGFTLNFQGVSSGLTYGIPQPFTTALSTYPDSKTLIESYHVKDVTGNVLAWGGLAVILVGAFVPDYNNPTFTSADGIGVGMMVGGLVIDIVGAIVLSSGYSDATSAVNVYNRHRMEDYAKQ